MQRQCAPAATGFDHPFAGLQAEFPADMVHLRHLGLLEPDRWLGKIGAGVEQLPVEPQAIEIVAKVVMVVDVGGGLSTQIGTRRMHEAQKIIAQTLSGSLRGKDRLDQRDKVAFHLKVAATVQLAKLKLRVEHQPHQGVGIAQMQLDQFLASACACACAATGDHRPIPGDQGHGRITQRPEHGVEHPAFHCGDGPSAAIAVWRIGTQCNAQRVAGFLLGGLHLAHSRHLP